MASTTVGEMERVRKRKMGKEGGSHGSRKGR